MTTPVSGQTDAGQPDAGQPGGGSSEPDPLAQPPWWARLDLGRVDLWVGLVVVAACCTFVVVQLEPRLLLRNTTPSGGDTAAHVWWPAYLRDHLLPWRLAGWSPDFYGGFSAGQFYFPVPALLIVALDTVIPYNIAFKLITALGAVLLPATAYVFGRGVQAPKPAPAEPSRPAPPVLAEPAQADWRPLPRNRPMPAQDSGFRDARTGDGA